MGWCQPYRDWRISHGRLGADGKYHWHWDPTRRRARGDQQAHRERLHTCAHHLNVPTLLVRGGLSDVLSESPFEVDFTFWYQHSARFDHEEEPVLVFGETKSFAVDSFKAEDIVRMRKLVEKFPGAFLVFAMLKDTLTDQEKAEITSLAIWGRELLDDGRPRAPVIVLTGTELFSEWDIKSTWEALSDQRGQLAAWPALRLDNLWTLADCTQQVYLDLPDRHEELLKQFPMPHPEISEG